MNAQTNESSPQVVRPWAVFGAALGTLGFAVGCTAFFGFTADDAFIVERYAQNLVGHGELAFNLGERVSALTSPLHALLVSLVLALVGPDTLELANKCLGLVAVLAACGFAGFAVVTHDGQRALFFAGALVSPFVWLWTVGGLETPYLLAAVTMVAALYVRITQADSKTCVWWISVFSAAALLLRLDSCLFLAPIWVSLMLRQRRSSLAPALLTFGLVASWHVFASYYFHDVLPTSFYVKLFETRRPVSDNAAYSLQFVLLSGAALLALMALSSWQFKLTWRDNTRGIHGQGALWSGWALLFAYSLTHSSQHMFFGFRSFVPYLPVLFLLLAGWNALTGWRLAMCIGAIAAFQFVLAGQMFRRGMSPTLSMLLNDEHTEEYDDVSLLEYIDFIRALERSAQPVRDHWQRRATDVPKPRLAVYTGGMPPIRLPEFFVTEELVSYRKRCTPNYFGQAHYAQILRIADKNEARRVMFNELTIERTGRPPEIVSREVFFFNGNPFVAEILFNANPLPLTLSRYVGDPCAD